MRHILLALLATSACTTSSTDAQVTSNLEQPNGGYDTADEAPEFGAAADFDAAAIEADAPVTDTMASDPTVTAMAALPTVDARDVIVAWGRIPGDPNATVSRDWSGQLQVSRGALFVRRTISFEPATDHLLPRTAKDIVAFDSITRPFVDGLSLRVIDPDPSAATGPLTLIYTSASDATITYSFDLAQLATGPIVIDAGNGFKMVAIAQHQHDTDGCVGGFMRGRWHALDANMGDYLGIVTDRIGVPVGHVRGIYGELKDGTPVVFGKFIDHQGHFIGLLAGTYDSGDFVATWKAIGDDDHGVIHGEYSESSDDQSGHFLARWSQASCAEDPMPTAP